MKSCQLHITRMHNKENLS